MPASTRGPLCQLLAFASCVSLCLTAPLGSAGEHPRLLIGPEDLARVRHVCGAGTPSSADQSWGHFGARAADFQALRDCFSNRVEGGVLPGELAAAAFLHLVDAHDPVDRTRLRAVAAGAAAAGRARRRDTGGGARVGLVLGRFGSGSATGVPARRSQGGRAIDTRRQPARAAPFSRQAGHAGAGHRRG